MTEKEFEQSKVIYMEDERWLTQRKGTKQLNVSKRHFRRLHHEQKKRFSVGFF